MPEPRVFRAGWRAALSGQPREACRCDDPGDREAWNEGYSDAERERAKDVADVRLAVAMSAATKTHWLRGIRAHGTKECHVTALLYWPLTDPNPTRKWWP